ncbi:hypothetical protein TNCV_3015621 [Trichonephila clavipes]|nr:hypothetical protein TNCV_3015621 [Trichonephila clavipes]
MMLGMAKVMFSILLSGMTAIGRTMRSGRRGYGASSGRKRLEFFWLGSELRGCSLVAGAQIMLLSTHLIQTWLGTFQCLDGAAEICCDELRMVVVGLFIFELHSVCGRGGSHGVKGFRGGDQRQYLSSVAEKRHNAFLEIMLDEAHFRLNGHDNKQNCRIWGEANPQVYVETPLHPEKLTVWCALWAGGILLQKRWPQRYSQW